MKFGFLVKNCIYGHLDMSRIPKFDQNMSPEKKGRKMSATGIGIVTVHRCTATV